jgi:hypothetical protein
MPNSASSTSFQRWNRKVVGADLRGDAAVDPADAVLVPRQGEREPRHVELARPVRAAEREELPGVNPQPARVLVEVAQHELAGERVVARGDRRVRREHRRRRDRLARRSIGQAALDALAHQLDREKRGVALVHVPHRRRETERAQHLDAADAEQHFLLQPHLAVAAVQLVRDRPVRLRVVGDVGVEQEHLDAPDGRAPDLRDDVAGREADVDLDRQAVGVERERDRDVLRARFAVLGHLVAVAVERLVEVALPVQQADRHELEPEVARRLAVIAREHPEAARVIGKALVKAVLRAEVRDEVAGLEVGARRIVARLALVGVEAPEDLVVLVEEVVVGGGAVERGLVDAAQEQTRVAADGVPQALVEHLEEAPGGPVPAEAQVRGELPQALQFGWQRRVDLEREFLAVHGLARPSAPEAAGSLASAEAGEARPQPPTLAYIRGTLLLSID